jgi:class 3 adenylate cyclase
MIERIETQVERFAPGFRDLILARSARGPAALEADNRNLVGGDLNGGAMDLPQLLFRPTRRLVPYRTPLAGVYICSASTPPGGGVHGMCGYSAALVAIRGSRRPGRAGRRRTRRRELSPHKECPYPWSVPRSPQERKLVTVLFVDLVGFTSRAERLDPEDVRAVLEPYLTRVRAEGEHFGGVVEKLIGDAVMAVFGAPSRTATTRSARSAPPSRPATPSTTSTAPIRRSTSRCGSGSTRAKRASISAPIRAAASAWRRATSSTRPPACRRRRRSPASSSATRRGARRPVAPSTPRSSGSSPRGSTSPSAPFVHECEALLPAPTASRPR